MRFEWDERKAMTNLVKHGVSFAEAVEVFGDLLAITIADPGHGDDDELREVTIGQSGRKRLVVVSHADRAGVMRIISARKATGRESRQYNAGVIHAD